jgi:DNA-binding XRE family transcriptional regulator
MLAVAKTPHIDLRIRGSISVPVLRTLKREYGTALKVMPDADDETVDWFSTELSKKIAARLSPGNCVKIYRENLGLTQEGLGAKLGVKGSFVSDIEHDRRAISKEKAKILSKLFHVSVGYFI